MRDSRRILFISMPWITPVHPSLSLGLLGAILARADIEAEHLYGNLLLPPQKTPTCYGTAHPDLYDDRSAGLSFVPLLYQHVGAEHIADTVAERFIRVFSREGQLDVPASALDWKSDGPLRRALMAQTLEDIENGRVCLARCEERLAAADYDVIGFSLTFETQLVPSLALARRIKERWPERRVAFGGAACASVQGLSMIRSFPWIDAICLGEGDAIIAPLVRALRGEAALADVPGIAYRDGGEVKTTARHEPMTDLDWLPVPDYAPFFAQKARSEWKDTRSVLLFETSRGCWWGEKHLCTFCGLNAEALVYRSKSAARVIEELDALADRHDLTNGLQAVDNILDTRYFDDLIPRLIERQKTRPVGMFFEIKSNVKLAQMFQLSMAGVRALQPGIEAFSDHILKLMDKGATAFQQITFIKWAQQLAIAPAYNLLLRNPGETVIDYDEMTELVPFIKHLQPPNNIANVQLERFSPYFLSPGNFHIRNLRPKAFYRDMFPDERVDLDGLVYQFDFDHDALDAPELVEARRRFMVAVDGWLRGFQLHTLIYFVQGDAMLVVDRRDGKEVQHRLGGLAARVMAALDHGRTFVVLRGVVPELDESALRGLLSGLLALRLVWHDRRRDAYIALPVRVYRDSAELHAHAHAEIEAAAARRSASGGPASPRRRQLPMVTATVMPRASQSRTT